MGKARMVAQRFSRQGIRKRLLTLSLLMVLCGSAYSTSHLNAQEVPPADFLDPLELNELDPLLPEMAFDRPLNDQERRVLAAALDELQRQAETEFAAGNLTGAFELWLRELRLRRFLTTEEEIAALTRVGEVAWQENQRIELRFITLRLEEIEQEVLERTPPDYGLQLLLAQSYERIKAKDLATAAYERVLVPAYEFGDPTLVQQILRSIAQLHLSWFDYADSAAAYQELLNFSQSIGDLATSEEAMTQLAYVYQQDRQFELAIITQEQLVALYRSQSNLEPIPGVKLLMAGNYLALDRPDLAAVQYQEAFAVARTNQQYGYATEALDKLGDLYRAADRLDDALIVYELLIEVSEQSYSSYGMMDAYDKIGQIHRDRGSIAQALQAFQQGLRYARDLDYNQGYFQQQIRSLQNVN